MLFTKDKSFYKRLILLSIPIALQNLITFCVNLADGVMVGALAIMDAMSGFEGNKNLLEAEEYSHYTASASGAERGN